MHRLLGFTIKFKYYLLVIIQLKILISYFLILKANGGDQISDRSRGGKTLNYNLKFD